LYARDNFPGSYFGAAVDAGAVVSPVLFLAFFAFLVLVVFLPLVVLAGVWLLVADGVWVLGALLPACAKLKALPRASVHAMVNNFFMISPLQGS
jgi:hypothetical protein